MIVSPFETPEPYSTELVHGHLDFRIAPGPTCSFIFSGRFFGPDGNGRSRKLEGTGSGRSQENKDRKGINTSKNLLDGRSLVFSWVPDGKTKYRRLTKDRGDPKVVSVSSDPPSRVRTLVPYDGGSESKSPNSVR